MIGLSRKKERKTIVNVLYLDLGGNNMAVKIVKMEILN